MTSQLSRQLISLSAPETNILDHHKKRASILFSASEAANFSRETYYQIGVSGFSELLEINDHFKKFEKDLFYINEKNIESLMMCILPYYETVLFVRILQTVDIQNKNSHGIGFTNYT
ncbi:hypothetical protein Anas_05051 [Armadillidium nasatum]|uniref:HEAT repeat-containing protein 1 n=1 Tax=Armadillidium nasatum TaxID=96803 RepID=A0A5N5T1N8_9CRUS|nr:hypothetical protein Anas_05051 [Armadillidium nasatum]